MIQFIVVAAVIYGFSLALVTNLRGFASAAGRYLVGKQRLRIFHMEHRRERLMRAFGTGLFALMTYSAISRFIYNDRRQSFDWWADILEIVVGLGVPIGLWWLTRGIHGKEIADDAGTESMF